METLGDVSSGNGQAATNGVVDDRVQHADKGGQEIRHEREDNDRDIALEPVHDVGQGLK